MGDLNIKIVLKALAIVAVICAAQWALLSGANYLRQHNISANKEKCDAGNDANCLALADLYLHGKQGNIPYPYAVDTSPFTVANYLMRSCELGNADSCVQAGEILLMFPSKEAGMSLLQKACELGNREGCHSLEKCAQSTSSSCLD